MNTELELLHPAQQSFDYRALEPDDRGFVEERALKIRDAAKRTAQTIVLIGQWLTEVKTRLPHGAWSPWLETEFGWSDQSARRFIHVYENIKVNTLLNLDIDVSALYLIAAPKTPESVRQEVIRRAESGEPMTRAKAVEVLEEYEKFDEVGDRNMERRREAGIVEPITIIQRSEDEPPPLSKRDQRRMDNDRKSRLLGIIGAIDRLNEAADIPPSAVVAHIRTYPLAWEIVTDAENALRNLQMIVKELKAGNTVPTSANTCRDIALPAADKSTDQQAHPEQDSDDELLSEWLRECCVEGDSYSGGVGTLHLDLARWCGSMSGLRQCRSEPSSGRYRREASRSTMAMWTA